MNLRHIDPRSTDWMDAMLERDVDGDDDRPLAGRRRTPGGGSPQQTEGLVSQSAGGISLDARASEAIGASGDTLR